MSGGKNYIGYSFVVTLLVVVILLGMSYLPQGEVLGLRVKRVNILADVVEDNLPAPDPKPEKRLAEDRPRRRENPKRPVPKRTPAPAVPSAADTLSAATLPETPAPPSEETAAGGDPTETEPQPVFGNFVALEDYSGDNSAMNHFLSTLRGIGSGGQLRIAFLGDSFIEGDILTADVREIMQDSLGGKGVGFVPVTSPVAGFRETVRHTFHNWERYSITGKTPSNLRDKYLISGYLFTPRENSWVKYAAPPGKKNMRDLHQTQLFFINTGSTVITITVNDEQTEMFHPESSEQLQKVSFYSPDPIQSVKYSFEDVEGFICYGASLEDGSGVVLDNYSVRGNSGMPIGRIGTLVNRDFNGFLQYDLIVLQYGLNVMSRGVTNYTAYKNSMVNVIRKLQQCYPHASFVLMGIGDRSANIGGRYATMPEVKAMIRYQREIAKECGIAYWDTFSAMGGTNSMLTYVSKKWAAKDYTHLAKGGGRDLARKFVKAIVSRKRAEMRPVNLADNGGSHPAPPPAHP